MHRWLPSCFWSLLGALAATSAAAAPRLVSTAPAFAFGSVERGTRVDHAFEVRNDGDSAVTIVGLERACDCTVGTTSTRVVAPGQQTWVSVSLDTRELSGPVAKAIAVRTSDPQASTLRLVLQGTVLADLVPEPAMLYLGEVRRGTDVERRALVRPGRPGGVARVTAVEARGPFVVAQLLDDGTGGQEVAVRVAASAPAGRFRDEVVLRTTGADPRIVLPVLGIVRAEVDVQPPVVRLRADRGGTSAVLQVVNRGATPVAVREVLVPGDVATFRLETVRRGFEYALHVELRPGLTPRTLDDRIRIVTDHPTEARIDVPLHAVIAARTSGRVRR